MRCTAVGPAMVIGPVVTTTVFPPESPAYFVVYNPKTNVRLSTWAVFASLGVDPAGRRLDRMICMNHAQARTTGLPVLGYTRPPTTAGVTREVGFSSSSRVQLAPVLLPESRSHSARRCGRTKSVAHSRAARR